MRLNGNTRIDRYLRYAVYACFLGFYCAVALAIPYTHDDWEWGIDMGIQFLLTASVNSRYVGNSLVLLMTRSEIVKTLIMGFGFLLLPYCMVQVSSHNRGREPRDNMLLFLLCNVLILSMDRRIWQQTYGWVSGYANFGVSAVLMVINLGIGLRIFDVHQEAGKTPGWKLAAVFLLSLASQLFLENLAIFMMLFYAAMLVMGCLLNRRWDRKLAVMLTGAVLGTVILFSNDLYGTLWSTGEAISGYRNMYINASSSLGSIIEKCWEQAVKIPYKLLENNLVLILSVCAILCGLLMKSGNMSKETKTVLILVHVLLAVYMVCNYFLGLVDQELYRFLMNMLLYVTVGADVVFLYRGESRKRMKYLTVWLSVPGVILPLIVTSEQSPRLFFTSNAIVCLFAAMQMRELMGRITLREKRGILCSIFLAAVILLAGTAKVYLDIGVFKYRQHIRIGEAKEHHLDTLLLPPCPHEEYIWNPDPYDAGRIRSFKEFYGLPQDVMIEQG